MRPERFQHFVAIDWSGAKGERQKGIAVALCGPGQDAPALVRSGHRWSRPDVLEWLKSELPPHSLIGFDLSPGLPFVDEQAYFPDWNESPHFARDLWRLIDTISVNDDHLAATAFVNHPQAWRHFRHGKGRCGDLFKPGPGRMRVTEEQQKALQLNPTSCFNLVGAAQVGKSSLTGMRLFHQLDEAIPIWPFDPLPDHGSVIVEIYTSLAARAASIPAGRSKMLDGAALDRALAALGTELHTPLPCYTDHATDAILTAAWLRTVAHNPALWDPSGLTLEIARTEGWTFGVT